MKRQVKTRQRIETGSWIGTPNDIAALAAKMCDLVDSNRFRAEVELDNGETWQTDNLSDLRGLEAPHKIRSISLDASHELEDSVIQDSYISLTVSRHNVIGSIRSQKERDATGMRVAMEEALAQHRRAAEVFHRFKGGAMWWLLGLAIPMQALATAPVWLALGAREEDLALAYLIGASIGSIAAWLFLFRVIPPVEIHTGRSKFERFRWGLLSLLIAPLGLAIALHILLPS